MTGYIDKFDNKNNNKNKNENTITMSLRVKINNFWNIIINYGKKLKV